MDKRVFAAFLLPWFFLALLDGPFPLNLLDSTGNGAFADGVAHVARQVCVIYAEWHCPGFLIVCSISETLGLVKEKKIFYGNQGS